MITILELFCILISTIWPVQKKNCASITLFIVEWKILSYSSVEVGCYFKFSL